MKKNLLKTLFVSSLLLAGSISLIGCDQKAQTYLKEKTAYLKIDGIEGESDDSRHKNWLDIDNYLLDFSIPENCVGYSSKMTFSKPIDKATPKIFQFTNNGNVIKKMELEVYNSQNFLATYYGFETCYFVGCQILDLAEEFSFICAKATIKTFAYDDSGASYTTETEIDYSKHAIG